MNCETLIAKLGFRCRPLSAEVMRLWTPFTYGNDGQAIALYVEKHGSGYRVSDDAAALMHASAMGAKLSKSRLSQLRAVIGNSATIEDGGAISSAASEETLAESITAVINATNAVSHLETLWVPGDMDEKFAAKVEEVLVAELGRARVKRKARVVGASGHEIIVPFEVDSVNGATYIQPIASRDDAVNWATVYQGVGRMFDLKNAGVENDSRVAVFEEVDDKAETTKALNVLSMAATVIMFGYLSTWAKGFPAARGALRQ